MVPPIPSECRPPRPYEWGLVALGVLLRLHDYLRCRSLWLDEAMLARNLIDRTVPDLFLPLDHEQGDPVGFLLVQKLALLLLGPREWSLRLAPLLLGIWSLFLFARLTRRLVGPLAGLGCLTFFAFAPSLTGATLKQYPVDVWAALALVTLACRVIDRGYRGQDHSWLALAGVGLVWVSHPAPLVLAAVGSALLLTHLSARRWTGVAWTTVTIAGWLASFGWNYLVCTRHLHANSYLVTYWRQGFPPPGIGAGEHLTWLGQALLDSLRLPGQFKPAPLALGLLSLGTARLLQSPQRFGLLALPVAIALAVAEAPLFPFQGRLVLFLLPFYYWLIGTGLDGLLETGSRVVHGAALAGMLLLLLRPCLDARQSVLVPAVWEEPREVLAYIAARAHPGDVLYVHPNGVHAFAYYQRFFHLDQVSVIYGVLRNPPEALRQLQELPGGRRVWVFHLDLKNGACPIEPLARQQVFGALAARREQLDGVTGPGTAAALFSPTRGSRDLGP